MVRYVFGTSSSGPQSRKGKLRGALVDEYTLAVVPYGQFLLDQLTHPVRWAGEQGPFLAMGGVDYNGQSQGILPRTPILAVRDGAREDGPRHWNRRKPARHQRGAFGLDGGGRGPKANGTDRNGGERGAHADRTAQSPPGPFGDARFPSPIRRQSSRRPQPLQPNSGRRSSCLGRANDRKSLLPFPGTISGTGAAGT
jgi:hypothetical protein